MKKSYLFFLFLILSFYVFGESRNALLIANAKYKNFGPLTTPVNEAKDLKKTLEKLGFTVTIVENGSREKMCDALDDFQQKTEQAGGIGVFHYGGHAVQVNGKNFLIPVDADIPDERKVSSRAVDVDDVMASMQAETNIVILDACRNNPLPSSSGRSITRGLSIVTEKPKNSIIVFSAEPGKVAQDGIFTPILTKKLLEQKSFVDILMDVRREVQVRTNHEQSPEETGRLTENIYLAGYSAPKSNQNENLEVTKSGSEGKNGISYVDLANKAYNEGDYKLAFEYFSKADNITDSWSQGNLGWLYQTGNGGYQNYAKAFEWYMKAAKQGDAFAQNKIGIFYYHGYGVAQNYKNAKIWFEKAAKQGDVGAINDLGYLYQYGLGVKQDVKKAHELYEQGAALGDPVSKYNIGVLYNLAADGAENPQLEEGYRQTAKKWFEESASQGYELAKNALDIINIKKGKKAYEEGNQSDAIKYFSKVDNLNDSDAQYYMGLIYYNGYGVEKNYTKAKEWFEKSAAQNNDTSRCALGWLYEAGLGVTQNYLKAKELYEKSAENNCTSAEFCLGRIYEQGIGVKQNYLKAKEWYEKAAGKDYSDAQVNLGAFYCYGYGVDKNYKKAKELFEKAAFNNNARAQSFLGWIYENGLGIQKNLSIAKEWYLRAAANNDEYAKKALENLK